MGIFDIFRKNKSATPALQNSGKVSTDKTFVFHPDLEGLIWIADGEKKNFTPDKATHLDLSYGITMSIQFAREPSLISVKDTIQKPNDIEEVRLAVFSFICRNKPFTKIDLFRFFAKSV